LNGGVCGCGRSKAERAMNGHFAMVSTWAIMAGMLVAALPAQDMEGAEGEAPPQERVQRDGDLWSPQASAGGMSDWDLYAGGIYANTSPVWVSADFLMWWMRGNSLPSMVTTSPVGTDRADAGVLGVAGTSGLHGDEDVDARHRFGFRTSVGARLGHWFDELMQSDVEASLLWLGDGQRSGDFFARSEGTPILARPFYNTQTGLPDSQLIAFPGVAVGQIGIATSSDLLSTGLVYRAPLWPGQWGRIHWLAGYRYLQLQEELLISEQLTNTDPGAGVAVGTVFDIFERYATWNEFHGADLGLQMWTDVWGCTVEMLAKLAVGSVSRTVEIDGETLVDEPGSPLSISPGGLYALPSNLGRYRTTRAAVLPEFGIRLRRRISHSFILSAGYTVIVLDDVVRTGDQLDLTVNPAQLGGGSLVGEPRPAVLMKGSLLWVHGLHVGLEW